MKRTLKLAECMRLAICGLMLFPSILAGSAAASPLGTDFTYQGKLDLSGSPINGSADFQFKLFGALSGGSQIGSTLSVNNVTVTDGAFTTTLDFGSTAFDAGDERWLEIVVRSPAGSGSFVTLAPRQEITASPFTLKTRGVDGNSLNASDGTPVDAVSVDANGKVGIGTTTPAMPLHVKSAEPVMLLQDTDSAANQSGYLGFWNDVSAETGWVGFGTPGSPDFSVFNGRSGGRLRLYGGPGGSIQMNGAVGIGTVNPPAVPLQVAANEPVLVLQDSGPASTQSGYVGFWDANGVETAWAGFGTPGSPHYTVRNARPGGNIALSPGAGGVVSVPVLEITGADLAEKFPTSGEIAPGMVVAIDDQASGQLCLARGMYNRGVAGVVSGANNFAAGAILGNLPGQEAAPPIALSGRCYVWCDASSAPIRPADLLTTSDRPGHAMKATDPLRSHGAVLGKAMTGLDSGQGLVLVLVNLQ